jgi:hypothetical protein
MKVHNTIFFAKNSRVLEKASLFSCDLLLLFSLSPFFHTYLALSVTGAVLGSRLRGFC